MSARPQTTAARLARIEKALDALLATTPATARPRKGAAKSGPTKFADTEFGAKVLAKAAAKVPCSIVAHGAACNRRFSPTSAGVLDHEPRIV